MERRRPTAQGWGRPVDDVLYVAIAGALALYLVIGVVAWAWMAVRQIEAPAAFTTTITTVAGGLIGLLAPLRPSWHGSSDRSDPTPD
jgi:hypothetical protein